jgi:hypothetical protein
MVKRQKRVVSVTLEPDQIEWLDQFRFDRSVMVRRVLDRYRLVTALARQRLADTFTADELDVIESALRHAGRDYFDPSLLSAIVVGILEQYRIPKKGRVNHQAIADKINGLDQQERLALLDAAERKV